MSRLSLHPTMLCVRDSSFELNNTTMALLTYIAMMILLGFFVVVFFTTSARFIGQGADRDGEGDIGLHMKTLACLDEECEFLI